MRFAISILHIHLKIGVRVQCQPDLSRCGDAHALSVSAALEALLKFVASYCLNAKAKSELPAATATYCLPLTE